MCHHGCRDVVPPPAHRRTLRPYEVVPGHPITIVAEAEEGSRARIVGAVARVTDVAARHAARVTPLPHG